jgi:hypothetical protein
MASVVQIVLQARNNTGPGFAAVQTGLAGLSATADRTALRTQSLTDRIRHQQDQLRLLGGQLDIAAAEYGPVTLATERARIRFDALSASMQRNQRTLEALQTHGLSTGLLNSIGNVDASVKGVNGTLERMALGVGAATNALGLLGVAFGAQQVLQFGLDAGRAANTLEKTEATIRALSGTQGRYNEVVALATHAQGIYGGTLQDQLENFRGLIPLSRTANVALGELDQTTRKLGILDPNSAAGGGAAIAIREFLTASGAEGARSLAERFELDRKALQGIIETAPDTTARMRALNDLLGQMGITTDTLTAATNTNANVYDRLGAAADRAKTKFGALLSAGFAPYAESLAGILNIATGNFKEGLGQVYAGGNRALGYNKEQTDERMQSGSMAWLGLAPETKPTADAAESPQPPAAASVRIVMPTPQNAPVRVIAPAQQTATVSSRASGGTQGQASNVTHINVNVAGNTVSDQKLVDSIHAGLLEKQRRNGTTGIK